MSHKGEKASRAEVSEQKRGIDTQKREFVKKFGKYAVVGAGMATLMSPAHSVAASSAEPPKNPGISLTKGTGGGRENPQTGYYMIPAGYPVTWTYTVTNTGDETLTNITLMDDKEGTVTCTKTTLAPKESMTCTKTGTAEKSKYLGDGKYIPYKNTATVTGTGEISGKEVKSKATSSYVGYFYT